jgi:pSer/pThr/pTyr-binding forkhead associated (FHA) protein
MFKLVIQDDEGKTTVVPLIRDEITIGRKEGNTIRLTERNVSRRHARILRSDNEVQIEDLGSYNGIRVNNARIAERVSLRISDQVQIGDYKLYLKAEGVEQVDDARTMPIERIDTPPAEMPAVVPPASAGLPTSPMPPQARPAVAPMAVADTDPAGRPVATAAQVAALTAPAGYGKFVVTSSNFAGKELDLTRPQMVIGRTDDNDLVLNHRSISRNHAKVTRDTETQRYTISDLQSSNGVRVNGQDYSKVELRRGDVVDLGHVRLRFVEPGEDFVFSRDAVIQDLPEGGRSRGLLVAIVLAVLVLGAVVAYFALKPGGGEGGNNGNNTVNNGGSNESNNNGSGSNVAVAVTDVDAGLAPGSNDSPELARLEGECLADANDQKWGNVKTCADQVDGMKPGAGKKYRDRADLEIGAQAELEHMQQALKDRDLKSAQKFKDKIPTESVYAQDAQAQLAKEKSALVAEGLKRVQALARQHKCDDYDRFIQQEGSSLGDDVGQAIAAQAPKCETTVVAPPIDCSASLVNNTPRCKQEFCAGHGTAPQCAAATVPPPPCDEGALLATGTSANGNGDAATALKAFEKAYACKAEPHTMSLAFMAACNSANQGRARVWWKKMSPEEQNKYLIMCVRGGITRQQLDGAP